MADAAFALVLAALVLAAASALAFLLRLVVRVLGALLVVGALVWLAACLESGLAAPVLHHPIGAQPLGPCSVSKPLR